MRASTSCSPLLAVALALVGVAPAGAGAPTPHARDNRRRPQAG